ncbi:MAG: FTR1 family protein [Chloroflexi bacterium]|nr:FTR1 family protein [Chloroflexota bacterium]
MPQAFLITLREGLEAALIVGIVVAYLHKTGNQKHTGSVWLGVGTAILMSLVVGVITFLIAGEFKGTAAQVFEGIAAFLAVIVLSYMVIWMKKQATDIKANLQLQVETALVKGSALALGVLAFIAVGREGLETVLFMLAITRTTTPFESAAGGLLGLAASVTAGYFLFRGSKRLNLRTFFNVTGAFLIIFAGGLLAYGIHELHEAGLIPTVIEHVWNLKPVLNDKEGLGLVLKGLFGYNDDPSLVEIVAYLVYLAGAFFYFFQSQARRGQLAANRRNQV